jgi:DNA invertase Pin-like site-specific DNA recombinase
MSTDRQEDSIDRQRSQVQAYAERHGYQIIREYVDEGIAGDEEQKRKAFMRMLADAEKKEFNVILCDDKDRFGRWDTITQGYYVKPLRDRGICLETVAQGRVDWSSFAGRITDAVVQEAKKIESQATSRRVITRMVMMAREGKWLGGQAPYGYVLEPHPVLIKRLIPGDPAKVRALGLIFRLCGEKGYSLRMISYELYERGILNPRGKQFWDRTTLLAILRNRKYIGDMAWNVDHEGKYSEFRNGLVNTEDSKIRRRNNSVKDWIIVPDVHEPLVSRELFEKVQQKLDRNKGNTTPLPKGGLFTLTGLLVCGDCGWRLTGCTDRGKRFYRCGRYLHEGKFACFNNAVMESKLLDCVIRKLQQVILNPENVQKLRDEVARQELQNQEAAPIRVETIQKQLADLDMRIERGTNNLTILDRDIVPELAAKIRALKEERDRLIEELESLQHPQERAGLDDVLRGVEERLYRLRESIAEADPHMVRNLIQEMVTKIELHFTHEQRPKKMQSIFRRGVIYIRPQEDASISKLLTAVGPARERST